MTGYLWFYGVLAMLWYTWSGIETLASPTTTELEHLVEEVTQSLKENISLVTEEEITTENNNLIRILTTTMRGESNKTLIDLERDSYTDVNMVTDGEIVEEEERMNLETEQLTVVGIENMTTEASGTSKRWLTEKLNVTDKKEQFGSIFETTDNLPKIVMNTEVTTELILTGNSTIMNNEQEIYFRKTTTPSSATSEWNYSASTNALSLCYQMAKAEKPSGRNIPFRFFTGMTGQKFAEIWQKTPSGRYIHIIIRFNYIGVVKEDGQWSILCVGTYDLTAHTYWGDPSAGGQPVAWVTIHTLSQHAVGIVRVGTRCFRETTQFQECSPEYYAMPFMDNIPIFKYSLLEEEFWTNLSYTAMGVKFPWIWKVNTNINTTTHFNNIPSRWIYEMDIPTLDELEILGNNWGRFEKLIRPIPTLASLDLSNNNMEMVSEDILNNAPILRKLILSYNNLSDYPVGIKNLPELRHLDISFSKSKNKLNIVEENINSISKRLNILKLENTKLKVDVAHLLSLSQMTYLNLSRCTIEGFFDVNNSVWHGSFLGDSNLTDVDLSRNYITAITINSFRKLVLLKLINLSYNIIESVDANTFQNNLLLQIIDLSYNKIKSIPSCLFCKLSKLEEVDLSHNQLTQIPYFVNVKLNYLGLSFNALNNFEQNDSFIDYIDMSNNNVSILQISLVKKLNLSYNCLSVITIEMWGNIIRLQEVDLGGNKFECCSFRNASFLKESYDTTIFNLGSSAPLTCKINKGVTEFLLGTLDSKYSSCTNREEYEHSDVEIKIIIGVAVVVIIVLFTITLFLAGKRLVLHYPLPCTKKMESKGIYT